MQIYRTYDNRTRVFSPANNAFGGSTGDNSSLTLNIGYIDRSFMIGKTACIVFDVKDENGNYYKFSADTTPKFDGYTFNIPACVLGGVIRNKLGYAVKWTSASTVITDPTLPAKMVDKRIEQSKTDYLVIEQSLFDSSILSVGSKGKPCPPANCHPCNPCDVPDGFIEYFKANGFVRPILYDNKQTLTFQTYNGLRQKIELNVPYLDDEGKIHTKFMPFNRFVFRGSVLNYEDLPDDALNGDMWAVTNEVTIDGTTYDKHSLFAWNGTEWVYIGSYRITDARDPNVISYSIGDNVNKSYVINHGLGTKDFLWNMRFADGFNGGKFTSTKITPIDDDNIRVDFSNPIPVNSAILTIGTRTGGIATVYPANLQFADIVGDPSLNTQLVNWAMSLIGLRVWVYDHIPTLADGKTTDVGITPNAIYQRQAQGPEGSLICTTAVGNDPIFDGQWDLVGTETVNIDDVLYTNYIYQRTVGADTYQVQSGITAMGSTLTRNWFVSVNGTTVGHFVPTNDLTDIIPPVGNVTVAGNTVNIVSWEPIVDKWVIVFQGGASPITTGQRVFRHDTMPSASDGELEDIALVVDTGIFEKMEVTGLQPTWEWIVVDPVLVEIVERVLKGVWTWGTTYMRTIYKGQALDIVRGAPGVGTTWQWSINWNVDGHIVSATQTNVFTDPYPRFSLVGVGVDGMGAGSLNMPNPWITATIEEWVRINPFHTKADKPYWEGDEIALAKNTGGFYFTQTTPSAVWTIPHGLNRLVSVTCYDNSGIEIEGTAQIIDNNTMVVDFNGYAVSGQAVVQ